MRFAISRPRHVAYGYTRFDDYVRERLGLAPRKARALLRLEQIDPRQSRVVECRFFGALTIEDTAIALGVSTRTVKRDWAMAQAWLHRAITG